MKSIAELKYKPKKQRWVSIAPSVSLKQMNRRDTARTDAINENFYVKRQGLCRVVPPALVDYAELFINAKPLPFSTDIELTLDTCWKFLRKKLN